MPARHSINNGPGERPAGTEDEEVVEGFGIVALRMRRGDRIKDHLAQPVLGRGEGQGLPCPASGGTGAKTQRNPSNAGAKHRG
jgi:hypothetical protein